MKRSQYVICLGGVALGSLDGRIYPTDIRESAPKIKVTTAQRPLGGLRATRREMTTRTVTVRYVLWERDKAQRSALHRQVLAWANGGGVLSVGYRDAQTLRVLCDKLPDITGKGWGDELELSFTAYEPYWQSLDAMVLTGTLAAGVEKTLTLRPDGTADDAPLQLEIKNTAAAAMSSVSVTAGGKTMVLSGLSLAKGKTLVMDYDDSGYLRIKADGTSVLGLRSAESADELLLTQRKVNEVKITANRAAQVTLKTYARWL